MPKDPEYQIFINYRQADTYEAARTLKYEIERAFEGVSVFKDNTVIREGDSLSEKIADALQQVKVILALVDNNWFKHPHPADEFLNRLHYPKDWVRKELEQAHALGKKIIPVLYKGATLPAPDSAQIVLPETLQFLSSDIFCARIGKDDPDGDTERLLKTLEEKLKLKRRKTGDGEKTTDDPLEDFPLPKSILNTLPKNPAPYLGLHFFKEKDARLFFGRDQEILDLWKKLQFTACRVLLLHGYSGVGKSSLLNAGFFPRLKHQGWQILAERRNKEVSLETLLQSQLDQIGDDSRQALIVIDQLEEAILDPYQEQAELPSFFDLLQEAKGGHPKAKFLLSFRKEFFPEVREYLDKRDIQFFDHFLKPLTTAGIRKAIRGAYEDEELRAKYREFEFEPKDLPEKILRDIVQDVNWDKPEEASSKAPLLQFQLLNLWEASVEDQKSNPLMLTEGLYRNVVWKKNLHEQLDGQIKKLGSIGNGAWKIHLEAGLALDILHFFTTDRNTAAAHTDNEIWRRYGTSSFKHKNECISLIREMENLQLLSRYIYMEEPQQKEQLAEKDEWTRLAHDALAPLVREKYTQSDQPGQRAHRIIMAKTDYVLQKPATRRFSESDIEAIQEGRYGMPKLSRAQEDKIAQDEQHYQERRQYDFELALASAKSTAEDFKFAATLKSLISAHRTGIRPRTIYEQATQLPYPLAFLRSKSGLKEAIDMMVAIAADQGLPWESLGTRVDELPEEQLFQAVKAWLKEKDAALLEQMEERFFPRLRNIPGGTFDLGAKDGKPATGQERPAHPVEVSPFQMADTPVTCWQYGLYCQATGRSLPLDSGFGRGYRPVINVSWYEAVAFCNWWSEQLGYSQVYQLGTIPPDPNELSETIKDWDEVVNWQANGFRLPTEAEWEFAAAAKEKKNLFGQTRYDKWRFGNGKDVADPAEINFDASSISNKQFIDFGWIKEVSKDGFKAATTPVKLFAESNQNPFKLHDMSGNVYEWCWDRFSGNEGQPDPYYQQCKEAGTVADPRGADSGNSRVVRGGSWNETALACRSSYRYGSLPLYRYYNIGFRVVRRLI